MSVGVQQNIDIVSLIENANDKLEELYFSGNYCYVRITADDDDNPHDLDTCTGNTTLKKLSLDNCRVSSDTLKYIANKIFALDSLCLRAHKITNGTPSEVFRVFAAEVQDLCTHGTLKKASVAIKAAYRELFTYYFPPR